MHGSQKCHPWKYKIIVHGSANNISKELQSYLHGGLQSTSMHRVHGADLHGDKWFTSMELHGVHGADLHGDKWFTSMELHGVHGTDLHGAKWFTPWSSID